MSREQFYPYLRSSGIINDVQAIKVERYTDIDKAELISQLARQALHFVQYDEAGARPLSPDNIRHSKETNCYGYAIVTSEALSLAGIENYILYANRHAMNLALDAEASSGIILDAEDTLLNSPATPDILSIQSGTSLDGLANNETERAKAILRSDQLLRHIGNADQARYIDDDRSWLNIAKRKAREVKHTDDYSDRGLERQTLNHTLMATVTSAKQGRKVLESLYNFEYLVERQRFDEAGSILPDVRGWWPEIDRRNFISPTYALNIYLDNEPNNQHAVDVMYQVSYDVANLTTDLTTRLWLPDKLRRLGTKQCNRRLLELARSEYNNVMLSLPQRSRRTAIDLVAGKIDKTNRLIDNLK